MSVRERIIKVLEQGLSPLFLEVEDFSHRHRGHDGYREGGESHFNVVLVCDCFEGMALPERHRMVYELLADEIKNGLHALQLKTLTHFEAKKRNLYP